MQQIINQLPDEKLLDVFVLIEDHQQHLAIEYLIRHTQCSRQEASCNIEYLIQQRRNALKRYIQEDRLFLTKSAHYHPLAIEAEDDFLDEFIINLDFSSTKSTTPSFRFKQYYEYGVKALQQPTFIYLMAAFCALSLGYILFIQA